ncbi:MAG: IS5 family transposase [Chlamydiales bacterium]
MRKRNWRKCNKALVQRGSLNFLIDPKIAKALIPKKKRQAGRPLEFSDQLIEMLLLIKIHYKLPYRMLEGFTRSLLEEMQSLCRVPTYSLTCKRAKVLGTHLPKLSPCRSAVVIVDSTGIKVEGEGEWKVKVHGKGRPRKWIKIHVAIDARTQEIVGEILTDACMSDGKAFPRVLRQIPSRVKTVIADGAYDGKEVRDLIRQRGGRALIPPPKHAIQRGIDPDRDQAVLDVRGFGGDVIAKSIWGKLTGYSQRALVETTFSRYKRMFGDRCFSRTQVRQVVENRLKCVLLNKMMRAAA